MLVFGCWMLDVSYSVRKSPSKTPSPKQAIAHRRSRRAPSAHPKLKNTPVRPLRSLRDLCDSALKKSNPVPPSPNIQHPTSNTQHPTSNTQHPTPNTQHPTPNTQHPTPNIAPYPKELPKFKNSPLTIHNSTLSPPPLLPQNLRLRNHRQLHPLRPQNLHPRPSQQIIRNLLRT